MEYPDIAVVDNLIQQCGCSLNYRKKLYGALNGIPIVEPVRLQYLNQLLFALTDNLVRAYAAENREVQPALPDEVEEREQGEKYEKTLMDKVLDYIEHHYQENLRLDEVAKHVGLNASYLSTLFKQELHINFSQYLNRKKMEEACRLLCESHMSLVDISFALGFENQSYFSRSFKKYMGMSPNQYRRGKEAYLHVER